ncbi:MAG: hypothetical protein ACQEVA_10675 [Myxococcota bacterium]
MMLRRWIYPAMAVLLCTAACSTNNANQGDAWQTRPDSTGSEDSEEDDVECTWLEEELRVEAADDLEQFAQSDYNCLDANARIWLEDDAVDDLSELQQLELVAGSLFVGDEPVSDSPPDATNAGLTSLDGLERLREIRQWLTLHYNPVLTDISALASLERVGGTLRIVENPELVTLDGLQGVGVIGKDLVIAQNAKLEDLSALHGVTSVGRDVEIAANETLTCDEARALIDAIGRDNIGGEVTLSRLGGQSSCD